MKKWITKCLFYIIIIFISIYIFVQIFIPHKTLDVFGYKAFIVVSSSMEPDINVYDMVIIQDVNEDDLQIRDIITFEVYIPELGKKGVVTHYIGDIETTSDETKIFYTQGAKKGPGEYDKWTNESGEPVHITYENISGEVIFTIPYIGHVIRIFQSPVMVALIVFNLVIIYIIIKLIKPTKKVK